MERTSKTLRERLPRQLWPLLLCFGLLAFGLYLRLSFFGEPDVPTWDEPHFVKNARHYLTARPDKNDHPPLGKLLIALSIHLFGDNGVAFRLPSLLAGLGVVAVGTAIARRIFSIPHVAWFAAAVLAIDGFLIAYSKSALLDGLLVFFALSSFFAALVAERFWTMVLAAFFAGLAVSIKISGVVAILPILFFSWDKGQLWWIVSLLIVPVVFYAQWAVGLHLTGRPSDVVSVYEVQAALTKHHAKLIKWKHPFASRWYTWLLPLRTIPMLGLKAGDGLVRVRNSMGHPLLWWITSLTLFLTTVRLFFFGAASELGYVDAEVDEDDRGFYFRHHRAAALLASMWWAYIGPWVLSLRDSYINHYLPSYAFGLILTAGLLAWLCQRRPRLAAGVLVALIAVAVFYAPIWGQLPIDPAAIKYRLFLKTWR